VTRLAGRRAIVTGAGSGIGRATVRRLADDGAMVTVMDIRPGAAEQVVDEVATSGGRAVAACGDVREEAAVEAAIETAVQAFGGLDTVVACAGVTASGPTHRTTVADWELLIGINLTGVFLTVKHALPHLLDAGGGAIVTIGSVASLVAAGRTTSYDAAKGGVLQFTRAVAVEYVDHGIRANCVCPGRVATDLAANSRELAVHMEPGADVGPSARLRMPMPRLSDPSEIAAVVAFLCSDEASFITGAAVPVDGGYTAI
jgi:NAD(P)-dependent dehydrogenase (short-subunit alcohol dehydrogenase family)